MSDSKPSLEEKLLEGTLTAEEIDQLIERSHDKSIEELIEQGKEKEVSGLRGLGYKDHQIIALLKERD